MLLFRPPVMRDSTGLGDIRLDNIELKFGKLSINRVQLGTRVRIRSRKSVREAVAINAQERRDKVAGKDFSGAPRLCCGETYVVTEHDIGARALRLRFRAPRQGAVEKLHTAGAGEVSLVVWRPRARRTPARRKVVRRTSCT